MGVPIGVPGVGVLVGGPGGGSPGWGPATPGHPASCRLPGEEPCWGDSHEYRMCQLPVSRVRPTPLALVPPPQRPLLGSPGLVYPSVSSPRTAPQGRYPSETCSALSTMATLSWAPRRPTNGCPSTGVSNLTSWGETERTLKGVRKLPEAQALGWGFEAYVGAGEGRSGPFGTASTSRLSTDCKSFSPEADSFQADPTNRKCCRTELKIAAYITGCPGQQPPDEGRQAGRLGGAGRPGQRGRHQLPGRPPSAPCLPHSID